MTALLLALVAALGVHYLWSALALGWTGLRPTPSASPTERSTGDAVRDWLVQAGLGDFRVRDLLVTSIAVGAAAATLTFVALGAMLPALSVGLCAACAPAATHRVRRIKRRATAQEAWPQLLEEMRLQVGSLGRSIPQALFDVGRRAPTEMRPAFAAAHREWLMSTDFPRTLGVLKAGLADPTADATCETLLVAHAIGGADLDTRLAALIEDRIQDTQGRKDARSRQAGARFARRFVVLTPVGMALAGMSVGNGRAAFASPTGQALSVLAVVLVVVCWLWAGRILVLPEEQRVFPS